MNITHNYSTQQAINNVTANQAMAVMPADLAQTLLRIFAEKVRYASSAAIIEDLITKLGKCADQGDIGSAIEVSLNWVAERELIQNIINEKWDAYEIKTTEQEYAYELGKAR